MENEEIKSYYQVFVTQLILFEGDEGKEMTHKYVAGTFDSLNMAKLFKSALENDIAKENDFVANRYTPHVTIWKTEEQLSLVLDQ